MKLYDQFGREIPLSDARKPSTRTVGAVSLLDRWSEYPADGLTPQKLARIFRAADAGDVARQAEMFGQMEEKDAHLSSQFQTRKLAVQGQDLEITPGDETPQAKKAAEFCEEVLAGLSLDDAILDALDALGKGYSALEIGWDISEGQAWIHGLEWIDPKKITFVQSVTPRILTEAEPAQGEDFPPFKFVYHRYKARSGYDTRAGIMRVCAWMYLFKNYSIKDWVAFSEIYGQPLRVGRIDANAPEDEKRMLETALRSIGTNAAGIISKSTEIEFIEATKTSSLNIYQALTDFCDNQISKAIVGQTLTSGTGDKGSYALGKVHDSVRGDLIEADCKGLARTFRGQILKPLTGFNFGWDCPVPKARFLYEPPEDLKALAEMYNILGDRLDISQEHVAARFKIPMRKTGETPLLSRQLQLQPEAPITAKREVLKQTPDEQHPADVLTRQAMGQAKLMDISPVQALLEQCSSLEDFRDRLVDLYADLDVTALADVMRDAFTVAELAGRFDASER
ncbi:MAG: DUF935 domain-containing protein [Desulfovibrio sp.]|uniref:DUF935 domain-containing protein n=1 Tax=Desulfovibrio sp. 7SRBS1 TaxID=3378064 RepID=UPI003B41D314